MRCTQGYTSTLNVCRVTSHPHALALLLRKPVDVHNSDAHAANGGADYSSCLQAQPCNGGYRTLPRG